MNGAGKKRGSSETTTGGPTDCIGDWLARRDRENGTDHAAGRAAQTEIAVTIWYEQFDYDGPYVILSFLCYVCHVLLCNVYTCMYFCTHKALILDIDLSTYIILYTHCMWSRISWTENRGKKKRWSPRTRMLTRMLIDANSTCHRVWTRLRDTPAWHTNLALFSTPSWDILTWHAYLTLFVLALLLDTLVVGHSYLTLSSDTLASHSCGRLLLDKNVRHSYCYLTHFRDTFVRRSYLTVLLDTLVRHSYLTLFFDTFVRHSCSTLWLDTLSGHFCKTLWLDTPTPPLQAPI